MEGRGLYSIYIIQYTIYIPQVLEILLYRLARKPYALNGWNGFYTRQPPGQGGGRKNQSCELYHPLHNNLTTLSRKEKKSNNLCTLSRKISALSTSHHLCLESASFLTISWYCQEEKKSYNDFFTLSRKISSFTSSSHCQAKHRLKNIYLTNNKNPIHKNYFNYNLLIITESKFRPII